MICFKQPSLPKTDGACIRLAGDIHFSLYVGTYILLLLLIGCSPQQSLTTSNDRNGKPSITPTLIADKSTPIASTSSSTQTSAQSIESSPRQVVRFKSVALTNFEKYLLTAIDNFQGVASGTRRWNSKEGGISGATYAMSKYKLGSNTILKELEQIVAVSFGTVSGERPPNTIARLMKVVNAAKLDESFDAWVRNGPIEDNAVKNLAVQIVKINGKHPEIQLFTVKGDKLTVRKSGIAFIDAREREAIWFYGQSVRMSGHQRNPAQKKQE